MKKFFALMIAIMFLLTGCGEGKVVTADMQGGTPKTQTPPPDPIETLLKSMTLEEKVGQMLFVGFYGTQINDDIKFSLNEFHFGGVILFDRNMESVAQTKKLTDDLQAFANQKVPLLVALDEEGGRVARGKSFLTPAPAQEEIGNGGDPSAATYWATYNAGLLKSIGVNINFAPVADVGTPDTRSFGNDAQLVTDFVEAAAQGYEVSPASASARLILIKKFPALKSARKLC